MQKATKQELQDSIRGFSLPKYREIPDVGLYLEQTVQYISGYLAELGDFPLTGSMIRNYVKQDIISNPVKKRYDRDQLAYLIFVAVAKSVLSMEDIRLFMEVQKKTYSAQRAYDYFRDELENVLQYVFGVKETLDTVGVDDTLEKDMLRTMIIAAAHKLYLEKYFAALHSTEE